MPNFVQSAASMLSPINWINKLTAPPPPTSLFQTRITHTPGGIVPISGAPLGAFDPTQSPTSVIQSSNLPPDQKAILMSSWQPEGQGFISVSPSNTMNPVVLRHEQIHQVQSRMPNLAEHEAKIASMVNPGIIAGMHNSPTYRAEMQAQGQIPVEAKEGTALDLVPGLVSGLTDPPTEALRNYYMQLLKDNLQRKKQFAKLTDVTQLPGQSQQ